MTVAEQTRRSGFSLRLEQGRGRLVLAQRRVADLLTVEQLHLTLDDVPARLDLSRGVERFRHARTRLDQLVVAADDHEIGRRLRAALRDGPLADLELRAVDGDLAIAGEVRGDPPSPFVARARVEPAGVGDERALLVSFYEIRVFGPARLCAPQVSAVLLAGMGLSGALGPTCATIDPLDGLLLEIFAELGWKLPDRRGVRLVEVRVDGGRVRLVAGRPAPDRPALRAVSAAAGDDASGVRYRRFLADYEAKSLYAATEALIADGQIERAVAAYERQLEVHPDHPFLVTRLLQLLVARPETRGEAVALATAHLERYPDDPDALTALAVARQSDGRRVEAAEVYDRIAAVAEARGDVLEAAQARCARAAALAEDDPRAAIAALERALSLRRRLPGALRALADLHARVGDWAAALRSRERLLAAEVEPARRRALLHELGALALNAADDVEAAASYYERALELDGDDVDALLGLAKAQERAGRILAAVRSLDRAGEVLQRRGDGRAAAAVMVRLGDLWRRLPDGAQTAALRYRQALLLDPRRGGALLGLAETAAEQGNAHQARAHLEELLRLPDPGGAGAGEAIDRADVHLRLGRLLAASAGDRPLAVAHFQKALDGRPEQAAEALARLEELYAAEGRWDDLARVLRLAAERVGGPAERGALLVRLATVTREHLDDPAEARALLEQAAALRPADANVLEALADLHRARGDHEALERTLAALAERVEEPRRLAAIYTERAELLRTHLNRADEAARVFSLALGCAPTWRDALDGLIDLYRERERFGELAPLLARRADIERDARAAGALWLELGRLQAGPLGRPGEAMESLEKALAHVPDDPEALRRLGDLCFDAGRLEPALERYRRLYEVYEDEGYDEPAVPFLRRYAEVLGALDRAAEALDVLRQAADEDPDDRGTWEQIQDLLLRRGDVEQIVEVFRAGLGRARRPETRAFLARRAGRLLWRQLRRAADAAPLLDEAARHRPDDADLRRIRLEVATALADWPRVADLLREQLERAAAPERPSLLVRLAELAFGALDRPEEGLELARAALDEDPDYVPAIALLAERAFDAGRWDDAREAYDRLLAIEGERARRDDRLRRALATLHAGDAAAALSHLKALQAEGDDAPDLLAALRDAALTAGDAAEVAALVGAPPPHAEPPAAREAFLRRAGALLATDDAHRDAAIHCWRAVLEMHPDDPEARRALALLAPATADEPEAPQAAEPTHPPDPVTADTAGEAEPRAADDAQPAAVDAPPETTSDVTGRATAAEPSPVAERPEEGQASEAEAPEAAPSEVPVAADLEGPPATDPEAGSARLEAAVGAASDGEGPEAARSVTPPAGDREGPPATDPEAERARLEAAIESAPDDAARAAAWLALAEHRRDVLHDPDGAVPAFREALDHATPGDPVWTEAQEALEDLFAVRGEWDALIALYDRRLAQGVGEPGEVLLLKASILRAADRLDDAVGAAEAALEAGEPRARDMLVGLLEAAGRPAEAAERLIEGAADLPAEAAGMCRWRAAEILADADPGRALALYAEAAESVADPALADEWLALARREGDAAQRVAALVARAERHAPEGPDAARRSRLLLEAAVAADEELNDPPRARALLEQSVAAWPDNVEALDRLAALLERLDDPAALAAVLARQVDAALPGPFRGRLALRLARLHADRLHDRDAAARFLKLAYTDLEGTREGDEARALLSTTPDPAEE